MPLPNRDLIPISNGSEAITIDGTAGGIGLTPPDEAQFAWITLATANINYTVDGVAPTSTVGHLLEIGDNMWLTEPEATRRFKAIRTTGTSGALYVTYWK